MAFFSAAEDASVEQLALDLGLTDGPPETVVSRTNADAFAVLERWPHWPHPIHLLSGPQGSGKSHAARAFAHASGGTVVEGAALASVDSLALAAGPLAVDDVEEADETALFHLLNAARAEGRGLILTAGRALRPRLADLASRLRQVPETRLLPPDDALLAGVMRDAFTRRQLAPDPAVIQFCLPRMERTLHHAVELVALLDKAGLAARRAPTRPLAAQVLSSGSRIP